jgi:hypothetical protein
MSRWLTAIALVVMAASAASAQDVKTVLANASKAMGVEGLNAIHYYGPAHDGAAAGQNNNSNYDWPRRNLSDYVRVIDFTQPALRASGVTWAAPVTGGPAAEGAFNQTITAEQGWPQQFEIWVTPAGWRGRGARDPGREPGLHRTAAVRGLKRSSQRAADAVLPESRRDLARSRRQWHPDPLRHPGIA